MIEKGLLLQKKILIVLFDDDNDGENEHYGSFDQRKRVEIKGKKEKRKRCPPLLSNPACNCQ